MKLRKHNRSIDLKGALSYIIRFVSGGVEKWKPLNNLAIYGSFLNPQEVSWALRHLSVMIYLLIFVI